MPFPFIASRCLGGRSLLWLAPFILNKTDETYSYCRSPDRCCVCRSFPGAPVDGRRARGAGRGTGGDRVAVTVPGNALEGAGVVDGPGNGDGVRGGVRVAGGYAATT